MLGGVDFDEDDDVQVLSGPASVGATSGGSASAMGAGSSCGALQNKGKGLIRLSGESLRNPFVSTIATLKSMAANGQQGLDQATWSALLNLLYSKPQAAEPQQPTLAPTTTPVPPVPQAPLVPRPPRVGRDQATWKAPKGPEAMRGLPEGVPPQMPKKGAYCFTHKESVEACRPQAQSDGEEALKAFIARRDDTEKMYNFFQSGL